MTIRRLFAAALTLVLPVEVLASDVAVLSQDAPAPQAVVQLVSPMDGVSVGIVRATDVDHAANVTIVEKFYEEICTAPCTFALDAGWHELHFEYQRQEWTKKVRIDPGAQELTVKPMRPVGITGYYLTVFSGGLLAPVGLPMWIGGASKVKVREADVAVVMGPEA